MRAQLLGSEAGDIAELSGGGANRQAVLARDGTSTRASTTYPDASVCWAGGATRTTRAHGWNDPAVIDGYSVVEHHQRSSCWKGGTTSKELIGTLVERTV